MFSTLLLAVGLMLVLEGLLPFVAPRLWRDAFRRLTTLSDGQLRFLGISSLLAGVVVLTLFK